MEYSQNAKDAGKRGAGFFNLNRLEVIWRETFWS